ncbi:aminoacyltransferase [Candidatus Gracilibacteria bacterium]|nr:aminoacyltransferase [Candidatus Gracilibacteria bacterium]MCF7856020.1 aminoacyltransferase [Candidatus Gracilibacteria bacterium]MCF7896425.1 aminoacyltransferase [Candidatus Gracilibacteria bacterium]
MEVVRIVDFENSKVKNFIVAQKFLPIQQTPTWAKFQKSLGIESLRFAVFDVDEIVAFVQIFVKKLPFGLTKMEVPRGPLFAESAAGSYRLAEISNLLLTEIQKVAHSKNAVFARFDFQKDCEIDSPKLQTVREENFPLATIRLDLSLSEEEILAAMQSKGRYNIRLAQKHGVTVSVENDVGEFFTLLQKTTARDGFAGHAQNFYQKFVEILSKNCVLLVARKNSTPLAAILVTFAGDTATYYFGASDHAFRNLMAPYLVQFEAIKIAQKRGCQFYDFLGIAPPGSQKHRLSGVSSFKKKFGGEIVEFPSPKILVFKPIFYALFRLAKFLRP